MNKCCWKLKHCRYWNSRTPAFFSCVVLSLSGCSSIILSSPTSRLTCQRAHIDVVNPTAKHSSNKECGLLHCSGIVSICFLFIYIFIYFTSSLCYSGMYCRHHTVYCTIYCSTLYNKSNLSSISHTRPYYLHHCPV